MVPHRKILRAIALVALVRGSDDYAALLSTRLHARFPAGMFDFVEKDIIPALTPDVLAFFTTTDAGLTLDYRPFFIAARQLGIEKLVTVGASGPEVLVPDQIQRWCGNSSMRVFLDTCLLCKIFPAQIAADMKTMWGIGVMEEDVRAYADLYVDLEYASGNSWFLYMKCVGDSEAQFKRRLMEEPITFVRWKLGVPVNMDSEMVIDRLMSDAYFTERLIKHEAGDHGLNLEKDKLTRIKMERQTIFNCMAMRVKMKELGGGAENVGELANLLRGVILDYSTQDFPLKDEVLMQEKRELSLDDLESENTKL